MRTHGPKCLPPEVVISMPKEHAMKGLTLFLIGGGKLSFKGRYLPKREKPNWHYYIDDEGTIYHLRKEHIIAVIEEGD